MKYLLFALCYCLIAVAASSAIRVRRPAPVLHSVLDNRSMQSVSNQSFSVERMLYTFPEAGPTFKHHTFKNAERYQKLQDTGIVLTVIGLIIGILGGLWVKSESD